MARNITVIPAEKRSLQGKILPKGRKLRVAAYCRVSTEQEEQLNSFDNQVAYYTKYITERPEYEMVDIYTDEGITGTSTRRREGFNRMIADCEAGKIDLVITKSISRFARNTQDCLSYSRRLKAIGVGIIFEKENINTLDASGELLFTILSSLAQEESRNISENSKWGIRHNFKQGIVHITPSRFLGYDLDHDGKIVVNKEQAKIVRRIFREFEEGFTPNEIAFRLNRDKVNGVKGTPAWEGSTIRGILANEKYKGDARLQKTFTVDYLTRKCVKNEGQLEQYYVENNHEAIVSKKDWEAVQLEMQRRRDYCKEVGVQRYGSVSVDCPFVSRVICSKCHGPYQRRCWENRNRYVWTCRNRNKRYGKTCLGENINEHVLKRAFIIAWNSVVKDRDKSLGTWERMKKEGNPLEKLRAKQMIELTAQGPLKKEIPELTRTVLERVVVHSKTQYTVRFLDGTTKEVVVTE